MSKQPDLIKSGHNIKVLVEISIIQGFAILRALAVAVVKCQVCPEGAVKGQVMDLLKFKHANFHNLHASLSDILCARWLVFP